MVGWWAPLDEEVGEGAEKARGRSGVVLLLGRKAGGRRGNRRHR